MFINVWTLRNIGCAPLELCYQPARRLSDGEALVHMIVIGVEF